MSARAVNLGHVFVIFVLKVNGNVKLFPVCSSVETLLQEYLFTERKMNVYNVADVLNLVSLKEHQL